MDKAEVIQVIRTTLTRRGDGKDDPIRVITHYWTLDGQLLAEVDPCETAPSSMIDALTDAVSRGVGGNVGLGFSTGYSGSGSRY